jgi:hypothetical protein
MSCSYNIFRSSPKIGRVLRSQWLLEILVLTKLSQFKAKSGQSFLNLVITAMTKQLLHFNYKIIRSTYFLWRCFLFSFFCFHYNIVNLDFFVVSLKFMTAVQTCNPEYVTIHSINETILWWSITTIANIIRLFGSRSIVRGRKEISIKYNTENIS